jgi:micrococcal nuclease
MLLLALSLAATPVCMARVHDGDTVRLCSGERIRIVDIDAPELFRSERCSPARVAQLADSPNPAWCDYTKGERARDALAQFLSRGQIRLQRTGTDRYGRTLARISVGGVDAGRYLIRLGLARRWR